MSKPAPRPRRRLSILLVAGAVVLFTVGVAWITLGHATKPSYQQRIEMTGMSGVETYLVNLWLDPHPPEPGPTEVTVQLTSIIGTPVHLNGVSVAVTGPDGTTSEPVEATRLAQDATPEAGFVTSVDLSQAGTWQLRVITDAGNGMVRESVFTVDVTA